MNREGTCQKHTSVFFFSICFKVSGFIIKNIVVGAKNEIDFVTNVVVGFGTDKKPWISKYFIPFIFQYVSTWFLLKKKFCNTLYTNKCVINKSLRFKKRGCDGSA